MRILSFVEDAIGMVAYFFGKYYYVAAITSGGYPSEIKSYANKPTLSRKKAQRVVEGISGHLKDGLKAEVVHLTPYVQATLNQWGTVGN